MGDKGGREEEGVNEEEKEEEEDEEGPTEEGREVGMNLESLLNAKE